MGTPRDRVVGSISALREFSQYQLLQNNFDSDVELLNCSCCVYNFKYGQYSAIGAEANIPRVELQCLKVLAKFLRHDEGKVLKW